MTGLDTNVLVRYLTQDDPEQAARASDLIEQQLTESSPGFISVVVLVETVWVLQRRYRATTDEIIETVRDLLASQSLSIERRDQMHAAAFVCESTGCGFADAVIATAAVHAGCNNIVTFDRGAARAGMTLLS